MDLKRALAKGIQQQLLEGEIPLGGVVIIEELEGLDYSIEAQAVTPLETLVRAKTAKGVRYFTVKVTENI